MGGAMTEPDTLFGYSVPEPKPWHVHTPPSVHHSETSQAAAVSIHAKTPSLRDQVYALLQREILTDEGIAIRLNLNPSTARPRRVELHNMGLIETHGTALTASGRTAQCWRAAPKNPSA